MYYGEKLNSITHLVGAVLALVGFGVLLTISIQQQQPLLIASFVVFGLTLILMYTMSSLYHSLPPSSWKDRFQKFDHVAIYLLIAGTYTPYTLVSLHASNGLRLLLVIWLLAAIGILLDIFVRKRIECLQLVIYLVMGWICVLSYAELRAAIDLGGVLWLILGGVAYTAGVLFYVLDTMKKLTHAHGIWHMFVLTGSICHFVSIAFYVR
jgi:hemolysin III